MPQAFLPWRGQPDPNRRVFAVLVLVSLLAHVPFTPLGALWGLIAPSGTEAEDQAPDLGQIHAIPVDLLEQSPKAEPEAAKAAAEPAPAASVPAEKPKPKPRPARVDAGVPADAAAPDAGDAGPASDAGPDASPEAGSTDPVALAGRAGEMVDPNANVSIIVYTDTVRGQPLGARVGRLLASVPQWRDFFGPGGLDPIRDFDRIFIVGPQLRNSSEVLAVLQYNVDEARILDAVGDIVRNDPQGSWLDAGVPAATAHADRAQRVFVVSPRSRWAIVTPPSAAADALRRAREALDPRREPPSIPPGSGNRAVAAHVNTPWRMFIGLPVSVPKSLRSAEMILTPTAQGGASIALRITDSSAEQARSDRDELYATLRNNQFIPLLEFATGRLVVSLEAHESEIRGTIELTPQQVSFVLNLVEGWFAERERARPRRPSVAEPVTAPPHAPDTLAPNPDAAAPDSRVPATTGPHDSSTPESAAPRP